MSAVAPHRRWEARVEVNGELVRIGIERMASRQRQLDQAHALLDGLGVTVVGGPDEYLFGEEKALLEEKSTKEAEVKASGVDLFDEVDEEAVAEVLSIWTGIPVYKLTEEETSRLVFMEKALHQRVIGQEQAIAALRRLPYADYLQTAHWQRVRGLALEQVDGVAIHRVRTTRFGRTGTAAEPSTRSCAT